MEKSQIVKENIEKMLDNRAEFYALFDEKIKQGNRRTCATLPYRAIKKIIEDYKNNKNN